MIVEYLRQLQTAVITPSHRVKPTQRVHNITTNSTIRNMSIHYVYAQVNAVQVNTVQFRQGECVSLDQQITYPSILNITKHLMHHAIAQ